MLSEKLLKTILLVSIVPFLLLFAYVHPQADDFCSAVGVLQKGFWGREIWAYDHYNGRYFAVLAENLFSDGAYWLGGYLKGYKIISLLTLVGYFVALWIFVKTISRRLISNGQVFWAALVLFVFCLSRFPSVAEGFYWLSAIESHLFENILLLLLLSLVFSPLAVVPSRSGKRYLYYAACILLAFAVAGGNEVTRLVLLTIAFVAVVITAYTGHPTAKLWRVVLLTAVIGSVIALLAPANTSLVEVQAHKFGVDYSVKGIILRTVRGLNETRKNVEDWLLDPALLSATLLAIPFFLSAAQSLTVWRAGVRRWLPIAAYVVLWLGMIASAYVLPYAAGGYFAARASDTGFLVFMIGWFFGVFLIVAGLSPEQRAEVRPPRYIVMAAQIVLAIGIISHGNVPRSFRELTHTVPDYSAQLQARYNDIEHNLGNGQTGVEVAALTTHPKALFFHDIEEDSSNWINKCYATFFHLQSIALKPHARID